MVNYHLKRGKGKLPLFHGNIERVIPIYAWHHKTIKISRKYKIRPATNSGEVIRVNQIGRPTPGPIPTHKGNPTVTRYVEATVFVDHYSEFTYVCLISKLDA